MTLFWTLAGALMLLAAAFVLLPLRTAWKQPTDTAKTQPEVTQDAINLELFRQQLDELDGDLAVGKIDPGQHQSARLELERELLHDIDGAGNTPREQQRRGLWLLPLLALLIPAMALGFYQVTGAPQIIPLLADASTAGVPSSPDGNLPALDVLAERLAARLEQNPNDTEGWSMLGRSYLALGETAKAQQAMERAHALAPDDLDIKLAYAEALAANQRNQLEGRPAALISEVLAVDANNRNARWLNGVLSFQRGQFAAAIQSWRGILDQIDPNSSDAEDLRELIQEASRRSGLVVASEPPAAVTPQAIPEEQTAAATEAPIEARIQVSVSVAPELAGQFPANTAVFVYAKAAAGPPVPLAVQRIRAADLPITLTLDDSMAMMPAMRLSSFPEVILGARISSSGQALPMPGDLQGESGPVTTAEITAPVTVVIDQRLP